MHCYAPRLLFATILTSVTKTTRPLNFSPRKLCVDCAKREQGEGLVSFQK
jgi:hypothetical protein